MRTYSFLILLILAVVTASFFGCAAPPKRRPMPSPEPVTIEPLPHGVFHTVGKGETLWRIAKTYGVSVNELIDVNGIVDPTDMEIGEIIFIPRATCLMDVEPYKSPEDEITETIERIVHSKGRENHNWRYITLHHSATEEGNAETFHRYHLRRGMGGLFYHFVIGNGDRSGNGEVEAGWRWKKQVEANRAGNIEICVVGNFNTHSMSETQYQSLLALVRILRREYDIPLANIRRHGSIRGTRTECPGKYFPIWRLKQDLSK